MASTGSKKVDREKRIPLVVNTVIETYITGQVENNGISSYRSMIRNGVIKKDTMGEYYVTQRPALNVAYQPPSTTKGKGIYYWESAGYPYFVSGSKLYKTNYSGEITPDASASAFTSAIDRVYWAELNGQLFISSPNNNEGKYLLSTVATTFFDMEQPATTGGDDFTYWPPNNSKNLAHGLVVLDKTLYAMDTEGTIWGSALNDGADWSDALNNINAEKEPDSGVYIAKHHNNLVAFGSSTIQFFYDAANATGSPLLSRSDVTFNVGLQSPETLWENGDTIYFIGKPSGGGGLQIYKLENFELSIIGESTITNFFRDMLRYGNYLYGSGVNFNNESYYTLTVADDGSSMLASYSFAYNSSTGYWSVWESDADDEANWPIVSAVNRLDPSGGSGASIIYIITYQGNVGAINDGYSVRDSIFNGVTTTYSNVHLSIITDQIDEDSRDWKFYEQLRVVGRSTETSASLYVDWSDNNNQSFTSDYTTNRSIDVSEPTDKLTRLGRAKSRSWKVDYDTNEKFSIKALDLLLDIGTH